MRRKRDSEREEILWEKKKVDGGRDWGRKHNSWREEETITEGVRDWGRGRENWGGR